MGVGEGGAGVVFGGMAFAIFHFLLMKSPGSMKRKFRPSAAQRRAAKVLLKYNASEGLAWH